MPAKIIVLSEWKADHPPMLRLEELGVGHE